MQFRVLLIHVCDQDEALGDRGDRLTMYERDRLEQSHMAVNHLNTIQSIYQSKPASSEQVLNQWQICLGCFIMSPRILSSKIVRATTKLRWKMKPSPPHAGAADSSEPPKVVYELSCAIDFWMMNLLH